MPVITPLASALTKYLDSAKPLASAAASDPVIAIALVAASPVVASVITASTCSMLSALAASPVILALSTAVILAFSVVKLLLTVVLSVEMFCTLVSILPVCVLRFVVRVVIFPCTFVISASAIVTLVPIPLIAIALASTSPVTLSTLVSIC
jgi:hypothetical protein